MSNFSVLVIGDSCEDEYVYGSVTRISPEAPVPVLKYEYLEKSLGMAANVNENLKSFGMQTNLVTQKEKIVKRRFIDRQTGQQLMRMDEENVSTFCSAAQIRIAFIHGNYDVLVISDYDKGFLGYSELEDLCQSFDGPVFVDTKKKRLIKKENVFFKINLKEYEKLDKDCLPDPTNLIVTLGANGVKWNGIDFASEKVPVYDVVGAGDTFLAALVYHYMITSTMKESIEFANKAAALAVQHPGTYKLTENDINLLCGY